MLTLTAHTRTEIGKPTATRAAGELPAVVYGRVEPATPIAVSASEFLRVWREAGTSSIIQLTGLDDDDMDVLIHDVDVDPVTEKPRHADFYAIERGKTLSITVPLTFTGVAPAVKELGGSLVKVLHEVDIDALPRNLPHDLPVDVSGLTDFEKQIHVSDLDTPEGVTITTDPDEVVALVAEAGEEEPEEAESAEMDISDVEVEKRGKDEEAAEDTSA